MQPQINTHDDNDELRYHIREFKQILVIIKQDSVGLVVFPFIRGYLS